ncbi:hypothetical protein D3C85_1125950 [compost metagenome]
MSNLQVLSTPGLEGYETIDRLREAVSRYSRQCTLQACVARPQAPWLGSGDTLHYARSTQGNACQPRLSGQDRRHSLFFVMQSPAPLCAGAAVACLSHS